MLALAACQQQVAITLEHEVPTALVETLPFDVGVHYSAALAAYAYVEDSPERGAWRIESGASQVAMFRRVLGDLFESVRELPTITTADTDLVLVPELVAMQFATPQETGFDHFESWLEYDVTIVDRAGDALTPWRFSGYGQAPARTFGRLDEGLAAALGDALRNAGARLATELPKHPPLRDYRAQGRR